ncbi:MAG: hypothetical protein ACYSUR_02780 [Planctomycetota bacterium]
MSRSISAGGSGITRTMSSARNDSGTSRWRYFATHWKAAGMPAVVSSFAMGSRPRYPAIFPLS